MLYFLYLALFIPQPSNAKVMYEKDKSYVCFPPDEAQRLLELRIDLPLLQLKTEKLEVMNLLIDTANQKLQRQVDEMLLNLDDQLKLLNDIEQQHVDAWYTRPAFYVLSGFLTGVVGGVVLTQALR